MEMEMNGVVGAGRVLFCFGERGEMFLIASGGFG